MEIETFMLILLAPIALGGVSLLAYGLRQRQRAQAAKQWPTANGHILSHNVERHAYKSKYGKNVWYTPHMEYEYSVAGTRFASHRISFGSSAFNTELDAESFLRQFGTPDAIQVHYEPQNPKNAVLVAGKAPRSFGFTLAGAALIAFPILLAVYFLSLS